MKVLPELKMKISAVIITYNRPDALDLVIKSILNQSLIPDEVIIADDGSDHDTSELLETYRNKTPFRLEHVWQEDLGYRIAAIRNKAVMKSKGDYLIFSDGDLIFHPDFFKDFRSVATGNTVHIGSRVLLSGEATWQLLEKKACFLNYSGFSREVASNRMNAIRIPWINSLLPPVKNPGKMRGGLLGVWKSDLVAVNGWDESYSGWGFEDTDLVVRLYYRGLTIRRLKFAALTYHLWHPESDRGKMEHNRILLDSAIEKRESWCNSGLVKGESS